MSERLVKYYYYHSKGKALWASINPPDREPVGDGLVVNISKTAAIKIMKKLKMDGIPYFTLRQ